MKSHTKTLFGSQFAQNFRRYTLVTAFAFASLGLGLLSGDVVQAQDHQKSGNMKMMGAAKKTKLALDGYCAVCLIKAQKWVMGSKKHSVVYDGQTYLFPSEAEKKVFQKNPALYVPALGGDCIVCKVHVNKMVPGSVKHAAFFNKRAFLFPSEKEKKVFLKDPKKYAKGDIALNGLCAVCATHGKKVAGKTEFTVYHNKMRYLFPEKTTAATFAKNPKMILKKLKK